MGVTVVLAYVLIALLILLGIIFRIVADIQGEDSKILGKVGFYLIMVPTGALVLYGYYKMAFNDARLTKPKVRKRSKRSKRIKLNPRPVRRIAH